MEILRCADVVLCIRPSYPRLGPSHANFAYSVIKIGDTVAPALRHSTIVIELLKDASSAVNGRVESATPVVKLIIDPGPIREQHVSPLMDYGMYSPRQVPSLGKLRC